MSKTPLISIITVVRNDLAGLKETHAGLCRQEFRDFDWVVVDGASTDGCVAFLETATDLPLIWKSERDHGIYDAMNKGTKMAIGNYVVYLNAGDVLPDPTTLKIIAQALEKEKFPDVLLGTANYVFPSGAKLRRAPRLMPQGAWHSIPAVHQAIYFKRNTLPEPVYDLSYRVSADFSLLALLSKNNLSAVYLHEPIVDFEMGGSCSQHSWEQMKDMWRAQKEILGLNLIYRLGSLARRFASVYGGKIICKFQPR
jgi:putative colanic acid biosynthesis glycosyltransferase